MAEARKKSTTTKKKSAATAKTDSAPKSEPSRSKNGITGTKNRDNQFWSVILFAAGVLIALMTLVKGSAGWLKIHNLLLGMFGVAVFAVPVILIYMSVLIGMEKSSERVSGRAGWGIAMTFLASAAFQIFFVGEVPSGSLWHFLTKLYEEGVALKGGGIASVFLAYPLLKLMGKLGAKICTAVLFFVFGMLLSGKGLIDFLKILAQPFLWIKRCFYGMQNMLMGGEFGDAFEEDDDYSDDREKKSFDKDMEAINIVNSRRKPRKKAESEIEEETPNDDLGGFDMDIPLPSDHIITGQAEKNEDILADPEKDEQLEALISRAADKKAEQSAIDIPLEGGTEVPKPVRREKPEYILPPLDLLTPSEVKVNRTEAVEEMRAKADIIVNTLRSFGVEVKIKDIFRGPAITRYEIQPGVGVKVKKITGLADDIALCLAAQGVRIAAVPGKSAIGIEIPNEVKDMVSLRDILSAHEFRESKSKLTFAVGKDITGNIILGDIAKMPHVIIAGTTGSGKSVCTRSIIMSILFNATPDEVKLILIDPKIVEFKIFEGIPHLLIPIVTDVKKAAGALGWAVNEMMRRYQTFADAGANDLKSYNELAELDGDMAKIPQIVIFIDELADMMLVAGKEVEDSICRLAQMGRAAGMHLVVATQRPTTDVITGLIKANIPSRIALSVKSQIDSRTIIDMAGADKLLGNGDMLYMPIGTGEPVRVQGCFASNKDISATIEYIKLQVQGEFDDSIIAEVESFVPVSKGESRGGDDSADFAAGSDEDYVERAMEVAVNAGQLSTSMLQRKLKLGYARAARIMDELEEMGVIGPSEGAKPRRVLMSKMQYDERKLRRME